MDTPARAKPEVFKPLIDQALLTLAAVNGADPAEVATVLAGLDPSGRSAYWYLRLATRETASLVYQGRVQAVLNGLYSWSIYLFEPPGALPFYAGDHADADEDECYEPQEPPVFLDEYPEEAREALAYGTYLAGGDGNVLGVWPREGTEAIFFAHYSGFEIIAEDPVAWVEKVVAEVLQHQA